MEQQTPDTCNAAPPTIDHLIGQDRIKRQIKTALNAHFNLRASGEVEGQAFPHVMSEGGAGVGKSLLAKLISCELGSILTETIGNSISTVSQINGLLASIEPQGVLHFDEAHDLPPVCQNSLLKAAEGRELFLGLSSNGSASRSVLKLPPFTIILTTTDPHRIIKPLRDRCKLHFQFQYYSLESIAQLLHQRCKRLGWAVNNEVIQGVAARSMGTPRISIRLLESSRRCMLATGDSVIEGKHFKEMLDMEGLDSLGLSPNAQRYLGILNDTKEGHVRLNTISATLGLPKQSIIVIEDDLIRLGLMERTNNGRCITQKGMGHLRCN